MGIFKRSQSSNLERHDSLLQELAMNAMAEHQPHGPTAAPQRQCQACDCQWPCPGYQLAQVAEIQARSYQNKSS